jgi:hypothetical protein
MEPAILIRRARAISFVFVRSSKLRAAAISPAKKFSGRQSPIDAFFLAFGFSFWQPAQRRDRKNLRL